jgi:uncharacterized repeat protein (TIGR02543 family)
VWTVTFNVNGGTSIEEQQVNNGDLIIKPQDPIKVNYNFLGWFADENFTNEWNFSTNQVTGNTVLYAKWRLSISEKLKNILKDIKQNVNEKINSSEKGQPDGVATLDEEGKIPESQLPSIVNDVLAFETKQDFPVVGEINKLYVEKVTGRIYLWSGTAYIATSTQVFIQSEEPQSTVLNNNDLWYDTSV